MKYSRQIGGFELGVRVWRGQSGWRGLMVNVGESYDFAMEAPLVRRGVAVVMKLWWVNVCLWVRQKPRTES